MSRRRSTLAPHIPDTSSLSPLAHIHSTRRHTRFVILKRKPKDLIHIPDTPSLPHRGGSGFEHSEKPIGA